MVRLVPVILSIPAFVMAQGYSPSEAPRQMKVADGLRATLFASEPHVRQSIFVKCDDRGRLWTIQYLQYPNPAGLQRVKVDRWSRTIYDRIPEPPPHGPKGADRITIVEDTDQDGVADKFRDFASGLNLVTGIEFGHGGVYVLNVPYLLFYPDEDRDDVPDGDPRVLLAGFGMEDAQSLANHLTWGPDGWLYGVNGSTTTCRIRGWEFQQGVWRYHPLRDEFELFCEGGSNCYGVTFNEQGELFYSTNGGPFVHAVQGGYFFKSFGKHGPLHNLFAYHYFDNLQCDQVPGGPPTGGTVYLADTFPEIYRGTFIAGNFLGHTVSYWHVEPDGSTVRARYGGVLLDLSDTWSGPTDVCLAPDGALYVSDFFDQRTAHPDPDAQWDRSNGRIYKIQAADAGSVAIDDIRTVSSAGLIQLLGHPNRWFAGRARVELARRRDRSLDPQLVTMARQTNDPALALQGLWALHVNGGLTDEIAQELLFHDYPPVRAWTIRLICDNRQLSPEIAAKMAQVAAADRDRTVQTQLAASAKRLTTAAALPILDGLFQHPESESDERIHWLIWWALEDKAITSADDVRQFLTAADAWEHSTMRDHIARLVRRYAAEGTSSSYNHCWQILCRTPEPHRPLAWEQLRLGLTERAVGLADVGQGTLFASQAVEGVSTDHSAGRQYQAVDASLLEEISRHWQQHPRDLAALEIALRAQVPDGYQGLMQLAGQWTSTKEGGVADGVRYCELLREFAQEDAIPILLTYLRGQPKTEEIRTAAIGALARFAESDVSAALMAEYSQATPKVQSAIRDALFTRPNTALIFLQRIERGDFPAADVPMGQLRQLAEHQDSRVEELVRKHWGNVGPGTAEEKLATMRRFNNDLRAAAGDPQRGKPLFAKHCGTCHSLFGEGQKVGPDLTTANRADRDALLANIVDPSAVVRREYLSYTVETTSGQVITGLLAQQDGGAVTIIDAQNQTMRIARDQIDELRESTTSLMPERILESLSPEELRDLFAYLQK